MRRTVGSAGFSLVEVVVSIGVLAVALSILAALMVDNSRVNREQQLRIEIQSNARTTLSLISQVLRTAGWDPTGADLPVVTLDSDPTDPIETLDVFADLNADGDLDDPMESVTIRHVDDRVEWRRQTGGSFEIVGVRITNDADGDGTPELMFTPDATPDPTRITVRITAAAPAPDPRSARPLRYTVTSDVALRNSD